MRHSGRVLRPPGPFPDGLFPDLWGFGASRELPLVVLPARQGQPRPLRLALPSAIDPLRELLVRIGRLFS